MTEIEAVRTDVAETNAQQVSGDNVSLTVHQGAVPRDVDMNERSLLNLGRRMHHLIDVRLRCRGGLRDVIVVVDDIAGVDIAAHNAVVKGGCRLAACFGALHD